MTDTRMSPAEREAFLADVHVGVLSLPRPDGGAPLAAPVWYDYQPGGELWLLTGRRSLKGRLIEPGTAVSLVAQQEALPYAYVSVEGVVAEISAADNARDTLAMAQRYLGEDGGAQYAAANAGDDSIRVSITIKRWLTVDYAKAFATD